ncbi:4Fe-4S binding protein, partial [Proteus mirabilis]|uniref:4Fe-4S binding protein n=1 Tax=Proteus mirabilis TaxID=584 RepID=UPI001953A344
QSQSSIALALGSGPDLCIEVREFGDEKYAVVNYNYCKGCGICASVCPFEAIKMELKDIFLE